MEEARRCTSRRTESRAWGHAHGFLGRGAFCVADESTGRAKRGGPEGKTEAASITSTLRSWKLFPPKSQCECGALCWNVSRVSRDSVSCAPLSPTSKDLIRSETWIHTGLLQLWKRETVWSQTTVTVHTVYTVASRFHVQLAPQAVSTHNVVDRLSLSDR